LISFPNAIEMFQFASCYFGLVSRMEIHGSQIISSHGVSPLLASLLSIPRHPSNALLLAPT
jgi:hypothetical protein